MVKNNSLYSTLLALKKQKNFVFLWGGEKNNEASKSFLFIKPVRIITTHRQSEIKKCFSLIEDALSKGFYAAGFLNYEASSAFESALPVTEGNFPLIWFGIYKKAVIMHGSGLKAEQAGNELGACKIKNIKPSVTKKSYISNISKIKNYIKKGDTYQVNYTYKYNFDFSGSPCRLFFDLSKKQPVQYAAFLSFDNEKILSFSPELFISKKKNTLTVKPMKGTIARGKGFQDDLLKQKALKNSTKDRAENIMIVDMLRNDLGRISETGTVKTVRLFETEKYNTLYQMTSTIHSRLREKSLYEIFKGIFPSGSVTGAPKINTMRIIKDLEKSARGIYTGAIGYISPKKDAVFNVAIRTLLLNESKKHGELGVGSGITIGSNPEKEYDECALKALFLTQPQTNFQLLESLLYTNGKFFLLNLHLERLKNSADYFGYSYFKKNILRSFKKHCGRLHADKNYKIRLLLERSGDVKLTSSALPVHNDAPGKIAFSKIQTDSSDVFLYHKTTNRKLYDAEFEHYGKKGFCDVIFTNKNNEVTEGAISNIIIRKNSLYYTPPLSCGLLDGVYRRYLFEHSAFPLREKVLYKKDIMKADKIYICNSVRGLTEAIL